MGGGATRDSFQAAASIALVIGAAVVGWLANEGYHQGREISHLQALVEPPCKVTK